jgi:hypothetical protein
VAENKIKYMKILFIEIEDLNEDLKHLIAVHETRKARNEITEYVCRENVALLENGRRALTSFLNELGALDVARFAGVKELEQAVEKMFTAFLEEHNFSHAVEEFVGRKMRKVLEYCDCE